MPELTLLAGKVLTTSLPVFKAPPKGPHPPALKRLMLAQGELAQFHDGRQPIRYLAFIELRVGSIRGNHYHRVKQEYIYLINGEMELVVQDMQTRERACVSMQAGDLARIEAGVAHALQPLAPGQAIEFSPALFDPADIFPFAVPLGLTRAWRRGAA